MVFTFFVFLHLIATCAAIGTIVVTDMRLAAKLMDYRVVIPRPERFETVMVTVSLVLLYVTGIVLIAMSLTERPDYLANGKLQAKLVLVGLLTLNAWILHFMAFPILALSRPVSQWTRSQWLTVAASVSLSNSLWFFCAFLGVARPWNFKVSAWFVLGVAALVWASVLLLSNLILKLGSRDAPKQQPDWVDSTIATFSDFARMATARAKPVRIDTHEASANQQHYGRRISDRRIGGAADRRGHHP